MSAGVRPPAPAPAHGGPETFWHKTPISYSVSNTQTAQNWKKENINDFKLSRLVRGTFQIFNQWKYRGHHCYLLFTNWNISIYSCGNIYWQTISFVNPRLRAWQLFSPSSNIGCYQNVTLFWETSVCTRSLLQYSYSTVGQNKKQWERWGKLPGTRIHIPEVQGQGHPGD